MPHLLSFKFFYNINMKKERLSGLFTSFLKIGLFSFGGGYAMIPLIKNEIVDHKHYLAEEDIFDIVAIAESTPGSIAINAATFVGYKVAGIFGATLATIAVIIPSFIIIFILSYLIEQFKSFTLFAYAFKGIRIGVMSLLVSTLINMFKKCPKGLFSYVIILFSFISIAIFDISAMYLVLICALLGILKGYFNHEHFN